VADTGLEGENDASLGLNGAKISTPFISKVLPVANTDTGWKPMLCYTTPSRGGRGCAELASESISTDRSTLRRAL
jgi:hypothetical protein